MRPGEGRRSPCSPAVGFAAVSGAQDEHDQILLPHLVDEPVVADPMRLSPRSSPLSALPANGFSASRSMAAMETLPG